VPVAPPDVCEDIAAAADEAVCLQTPSPLNAVGAWYDEHATVTDDDVRALLEQARRPPPQPACAVHPLSGSDADYDPLIERAAGKRFVLIGEASHGTHDFYRERAEITKRLITEAGFTVVAVEADWPDAYRVNRYVRGAGDDATPDEALSDFRRFPAWMWRNTEVAGFVGWLREHNEGLAPGAPRAGFYGLDLYSLHTSMQEVVRYLEEVDPDGAARARERYACFDHFGPDPQVYAYEAGLAGAEPCEQQAIAQLRDLQGRIAERAAELGIDEDRHFYAEQNARLVVDAEAYYRSSFRGGIVGWNLRDSHMAETLAALVEHLERSRGAPAKAVVWEHNSHLGDARATELGQAGEHNVGQLVRRQAGDGALLVGQTTFAGTVTAASDWGGPAERKRVRRGLTGSWEELFHQMGLRRFLLDTAGVEGRRLERAIGVIYRPETERVSHYFHARLAEQFDMVLHLDETRALEPLEITSEWEQGELPETYPMGV
jgi:erythromycin esterase-like protein